jgi:hypothetical protein
VNDPEGSAENNTASTADGFQISARPLVGASSDRPAPGSRTGNGLPASYGTDLLYVIARDPGTLFLYWDLNWTRLFAQADLSPRQVHLRIYREDGSVEGTREINPFRGHCYVDVTAGGTAYYCELGCLDGKEWTRLVRSGKAATPEAAMSDDLSAEFATLPLHLSFQRLLEVFEANNSDGKSLAHSVAELQENAREEMTAEEWSQVLASQNGNGGHSAEIANLLEVAQQAGSRGALTPEQMARWKELSEHLGGSSWGGASESGFGGSSPA